MIRLEEVAELIALRGIVEGVVASESMGIRIIGILMSRVHCNAPNQSREGAWWSVHTADTNPKRVRSTAAKKTDSRGWASFCALQYAVKIWAFVA